MCYVLYNDLRQAYFQCAVRFITIRLFMYKVFWICMVICIGTDALLCDILRMYSMDKYRARFISMNDPAYI